MIPRVPTSDAEVMLHIVSSGAGRYHVHAYAPGIAVTTTAQQYSRVKVAVTDLLADLLNARQEIERLNRLIQKEAP